MIASGYSLHVYCDVTDCEGRRHPVELPSNEEFAHESKAVCWRMARKAGWRFAGGRYPRYARCPKCVGAGKLIGCDFPTSESPT